MNETNRRTGGCTRREAMGRAGFAAAGAMVGAVSAAGGTKAMREEIELSNERLRVVATPDGAGILSFKVRMGGGWVDVYPDAARPEFKMHHASWMMVPYSNRIENGVFTFEGKEYRLRDGKAHSIHGDVRGRPWTVAERGHARLRMTLRSADFADFNWPWPIDIEAGLELDGPAFTQTLRIVNRGATSMPAGFGWHPYYLRALTRPGEPVLLQAKCAGVHPDANGDCIPDGPMEPLSPDLDYSSPKQVPTDRRYDTCLGGYDGKGGIEWPDSGVKLAFECSPNVTHFVYYNPIDRPYFAAEPAANANNGVNLSARGWKTHGVLVLPAGAAFDARFVTRLV